MAWGGKENREACWDSNKRLIKHSAGGEGDGGAERPHNAHQMKQ